MTIQAKHGNASGCQGWNARSGGVHIGHSKLQVKRGIFQLIFKIPNTLQAETKRINKELANIRGKFKGDKTLDGYHKKKYVCKVRVHFSAKNRSRLLWTRWKLLFIFLLGHDVDFGHIEAVNLLSSNKYTEKQIGYLFISVLLNEGNDLIKLIIQNIKNDLSSRNPVHVNLALHCIANVGTPEMAEAFFSEIPKLLISKEDIDSGMSFSEDRDQ